VESQDQTRISVFPPPFEESEELGELPHAAILASIATAPPNATAFVILVNFIVLSSFLRSTAHQSPTTERKTAMIFIRADFTLA
jgi:hypothetical protein